MNVKTRCQLVDNDNLHSQNREPLSPYIRLQMNIEAIKVVNNKLTINCFLPFHKISRFQIHYHGEHYIVIPERTSIL